jgi:hypothetical protein
MLIIMMFVVNENYFPCTYLVDMVLTHDLVLNAKTPHLGWATLIIFGVKSH